MLIEAMKCHPIPASTPLTEATPVAHSVVQRGLIVPPNVDSG